MVSLNIENGMNRKGYSFFLFLQIILLVCSFSAAGEETKEGDRRSFEKTDWNQEIYFDFEQIPLYDLLNRLAKENRFSFFIDRRVDTEIRVTASTESVPIMTALTSLAESAGLEAVRIGSVVYIGPPESGGELLLLIAKHRKTEGDGGLDQVFLPQKGVDYIIPSELLKMSAKRIGYSWIGLDKMPFDCWRADSINSLKTRELFLLTLIGYNVDYEIDPGKEKRLKPIPLDRTGPAAAVWNAEDLSNLDLADYPRVEFSRIRNEVRGSGPFSDLAKIEYAVSKERELRVFRRNAADEEEKEGRMKPRRESEKIKTVKGEVKQVTLRDLAGQLKKDIGLVIVLDPELDKVGITFNTRLSCQFDDCGPEETVKVIAEELGISFRMEGKRGILFPRK